MPEDRINYIQVQWDILNRFLENSPYVCGNEITIADFCLIATATSLTDIAPMNLVEHSNVLNWIERMAKLTYYEETNGAGARDVQTTVRAILKGNQNS